MWPLRSREVGPPVDNKARRRQKNGPNTFGFGINSVALDVRLYLDIHGKHSMTESDSNLKQLRSQKVEIWDVQTQNSMQDTEFSTSV